MEHTAAQKLQALREKISAHGLDGYLVPQTDEYQNEFVPACFQRLPWLTGFTGSAGIAIVLQDKAVVLTDGRYTIQVKDEVNSACFTTGDSTKIKVGAWLIEHAKSGAKIGFDPQLFTHEQIEKIKEIYSSLVSIEQNLIDEIWENRPEKPASHIEAFPHEVAGLTAAEKISQISTIVKQNDGDAVLLTAPESVCWLLNIRAQDTPCTPLVLSEVLVRADGSATWFIDEGRVSKDIRVHIGETVTISSALGIKNIKILLDLKRSPVSWKNRLEAQGCTVIAQKDPCIDVRASKTDAEIQSIKDAHAIDGVAVTKLLRWVDERQGHGITELNVAEKIDELRAAHDSYRGESFNCIAGMESNGAIIHYRPTIKTNKKIEGDGLLLIDSGGQYAGNGVYGTTDITRTVAIGTPTDEMKDMFTRVLKGHIGIARAIFPAGTTGKDIDVFARKALQEIGADYAHGTGHGVGCYLSVHEEAASISPRSEEPLKPGMLLSNEPGYYKEGEYGIRIENLVLVVEREDHMLGFETITLAPMDERLIKRDMLTVDEKNWLDAYHDRVDQMLSETDNL